MAVAAMAGMTSCSNEEVVAPATGGDGNVNFTVSLPGSGFATRAFADGMSAEHLQMAVYDADNGDLVMTPEEVTFEKNALSTQVSLNLAAGRNYKIAFFANPHAGSDADKVYTFSAENKTISVNYDKMKNDYNSKDYDCFYALYETGVVSAPINDNVTLTRPVAQINWGTSDLEEGVVVDDNAYGASAANLVTKVTAKAYSTFDLLTGDVSDEVDVEMPYLARPAEYDATSASGEKFPVEHPTYKYLSMHYLLVPKDNSVVDLTLYAHNTPNPAEGTQAMSTVTVTNAPVQANYRTNIYGALLTNPAEFTVTKDKDFTEPDNNIKVVRTAAALADALKEGGEIEVPEDVELDLSTEGKIDINNNTVLNVEGVVKTARQVNDANIVVAPEATLTVTGGGTFSADNRIIDVNGTLIVEDANFETSTKTKGAAITVNPNAKAEFNGGSITAANCAVWVEGEFVLNGGKLKSTNSSSDSEVAAVSGWSYALRAISKTGNIIINGGEVEGVQGAVGAYAGTITINDGYFHTHPRLTNSDNFYALYVADNDAAAIVNGGKFYAEGQPDVYFVDNHATISLKGGTYEDQGRWVTGNDNEPTTINGIVNPAEGYEWVAIEGDDTFKWKVVPKE